MAPKYRRWKTRNQAFAEHRGHRVYFPGEYGSDESLEAYRAWLAKIEADNRPGGLFISELGERYLDHCAELYGAGHRTAAGAAGLAIRELIHSEWGRLPVTKFGPKALAAFQASLAARELSRATVNGRISWVRRMVRWAVSAELVGADVLRALETVPGLRRGRPGAVESKPREPVAWRDVGATVAELPPQLRAAVLFQWHTGARSGSIVSARGDQFVPDAQNAELLLWHPRHKTEYLGSDLVIPVGPRAREVITHYLAASRGGLLFTPRRARHNGKAREAYTAWSYRKAIVRAQDRAIRRGTLAAHWTPHQLRHARGHAIRERYGLEAAQAALGHASITATQIYSAARLDLARTIALAEG